MCSNCSPSSARRGGPVAESASMPRVALLARPGAARDRLAAALRDIGAELVLEADPNESDDDAVLASGARAVVMVLEPAMDGALERYDRVLGDPGIDLLFEEAELAARREGWDAARWARHLSAKLAHTTQVLPPARDAATDDMAGDAAWTDPQAATTQAPLRADADRFALDMEELERRIAGMELVDDRIAAPAAETGAALVVAGIGGPDAVRQLLAALPADLPRPLLVQQRLDAGQHGKFVRQLQRASAMPVELAHADAPLQAGHVYVLPAGLGPVASPQGVRFGEIGASDLAAVPSGDSAIVFLSGSDPALADAVMSQAWGGALVLAQSSAGCFDTKATEALIARGVESGTPTDIARRLVARWRK